MSFLVSDQTVIASLRQSIAQERSNIRRYASSVADGWMSQADAERLLASSLAYIADCEKKIREKGGRV